MTETYKKAFKEVYVILQYLDDIDYAKIPSDITKVIEENMDQNYIYHLDKNLDISQQKMMIETKAILFNFFRDYLCTEKQRETIIKIQNKQRLNLEEQKKKNYPTSNSIFKEKEKVVENNITLIPNNNIKQFYVIIKNRILKLLNILK